MYGAEIKNYQKILSQDKITLNTR